MILLFLLKKFVSFWLTPLSIFFVLAAAGLWCRRSARRARAGNWLLGGALVWLLAASHPAVGDRMLRSLEEQNPPIPELDRATLPPDLAACRYVVVLGGGNGHTRGMAALGELSGPSACRVAEGVRLLHRLPEAQLILTGPEAQKFEAHSRIGALAAVSLGADPRRVIALEGALDTEDEARLVRAKIGDAPFALVTSAWHMPRAVALFRNQGLRPLPAPTDFRTHEALEGVDVPGVAFIGSLGWNLEALTFTSLAMRERIGYLWIWLRRKT